MALLSLQAFKNKWASLTGRFKDNNSFEIDEQDYREFSGDIADSLFDPVERLQARVEKLEQPAPVAREGVKWRVAPKVKIVGSDVVVTAAEAEFDELVVPFAAGIAKSAVPTPPADFDRIDILAATSTGWVYIFGEEPGITPTLDPEFLFAAYLFWSSEGGEVEAPVVFVKTVNGQGPDPSGNVNVTSGKVDTINGQLPDADKNVTIGAEHIDTDVNDSTWWGTAKVKVKGVADRLANEIKLLQANKADLVGGKVPVEQLPEIGTSINSTDDIATEGATNKWFTEARAIASKLAGYSKATTIAAIESADSIQTAIAKLEKKADDNTESLSYTETSYAFLGGLEASDRYSFAVEFTSIDPGQRLTDVQISVDDAAYMPLTVGFKIAAGKRFKLKVTYLTATLEGVLITRVKKQ